MPFWGLPPLSPWRWTLLVEREWCLPITIFFWTALTSSQWILIFLSARRKPCENEEMKWWAASWAWSQHRLSLGWKDATWHSDPTHGAPDKGKGQCTKCFAFHHDNFTNVSAFHPVKFLLTLTISMESHLQGWRTLPLFSKHGLFPKGLSWKRHFV